MIRVRHVFGQVIDASLTMKALIIVNGDSIVLGAGHVLALADVIVVLAGPPRGGGSRGNCPGARAPPGARRKRSFAFPSYVAMISLSWAP